MIKGDSRKKNIFRNRKNYIITAISRYLPLVPYKAKHYVDPNIRMYSSSNHKLCKFF